MEAGLTSDERDQVLRAIDARWPPAEQHLTLEELMAQDDLPEERRAHVRACRACSDLCESALSDQKITDLAARAAAHASARHADAQAAAGIDAEDESALFDDLRETAESAG